MKCARSVSELHRKMRRGWRDLKDLELGNVMTRLGIRSVFGVSLFALLLLPLTANSQSLTGTKPENANMSEPELRFNFSGADWRSVLTWFADESDMSLEWVELPEGEFNLVTEKTYSVSESLDILNMHLISRGFTLTRRDQILVLLKLDENFDTTLIPRVQLNELDDLGSFDFVKVSFALDWMLAESAVNELAPMLSPYGRLVPLSRTNRIEAMDIAGNLREVRDLLAGEESDTSQERLVTEFVLEHTSALDIIGKLNQLLGVEKPLNRMSNTQMRVMREQFAFKAEMAKRMGDNAPSIQEKKTDVYLVANEHRNSIVANAPPDKIALIKQAVQSLDVPDANNGARLSEITTMKVYPLDGADPDAVADILQDLVDIGELHPNARFSEDEDKQILFAYASLKDHITISSVMDQLAKSSRSFRVIHLRKLKASFVASSIESLMGAETSNSYSRFGRRGRRQGNENSWNGFKVEADIANNRLFLFATESENQQVEELLVKIGERSANSSTARVIKIAPEAFDNALETLRSQWPAISDNPLNIKAPSHSSRDDSSRRETSTTPAADAPQASKRESDVSYIAFNEIGEIEPDMDDSLGHSSTERDSQMQATAIVQLPRAEDWMSSKPPVTLQQSGAGELVISSEDPVALQQMENLLSEFLPPDTPYSSFSLTHITPIAMESKLNQIFGSDSTGAELPIKFVTDSATNSILVLGAGPTELREMEDLIEFYDKPPMTDPLLERKPHFISLKHASATSIATAVKDLYRDYLSANDRDNRPTDRDQEPAFVSSINSGLLSVAVYSDTNTIVISAPEYLAAEVKETILGLDVEDASTIIHTVPLGDGLYSEDAMTQLANLLKPIDPASNTNIRVQSTQGRSAERNRNDRNATPAAERFRRRPQR